MEGFIERTALKEIIRKYCDDFHSKMGFNYVAKDSIPIVWFGNVERYFKSPTKMLTIALNPSCIEFPKWGKQRFQDLTTLRREIILKEFPIDLLINNYNDYFRYNPYMHWFNYYERILNGVGCSYFDGIAENTAIHIDMYSAIATDPTWGKLAEGQRNRIQNTSLFKELLQILNPEIVFISVNLPAFKEVIEPGESIKEWVGAFDYTNKMILYKKDGMTILHGRNVEGKPFRNCMLTEEIKRMLFD